LILVFANFIASLGQNDNSTAVVIGAMLVSPLMGPIIGLGLGMAINDLALLRKAIANYALAVLVGLLTSTVYFALSPLTEASTEILARTSPNIYDVLIALFGGFAGILAVSSKQKGNVIPGVAIATALMPPLCTAGYGLAHLNFAYLFGASYLFVINTVCIALATLVTARMLKFPFKHLPEKRDETFAKRIVAAVVVVTILPSLYFGYDIIQQARFRQRANRFIAAEANFANDYLLKKSIDAKKGQITLTYGGEFIREGDIERLRSQLPKYDLASATLDVQQGFAYLGTQQNDTNETKVDPLTQVVKDKDAALEKLSSKLDAVAAEKDLVSQVCDELKIQYPKVNSCSLSNPTPTADAANKNWTAALTVGKPFPAADRSRLEEWLTKRLSASSVEAVIDLRKPSPANANR
jgi:uncharacterized hydrophobic protein (TIGR00271 family)